MHAEMALTRPPRFWASRGTQNLKIRLANTDFAMVGSISPAVFRSMQNSRCSWFIRFVMWISASKFCLSLRVFSFYLVLISSQWNLMKFLMFSNRAKKSPINFAVIAYCLMRWVWRLMKLYSLIMVMLSSSQQIPYAAQQITLIILLNSSLVCMFSVLWISCISKKVLPSLMSCLACWK